METFVDELGGELGLRDYSADELDDVPSDCRIVNLVD